MLWTVGMSVGLAGKASLLHWDPDKVLHASTEDPRYSVSLLLRYSSRSGTPCVGMEVAFRVLQGEAGARALGLRPFFWAPKAQDECFAGATSVPSTASLLGWCHSSGLLSPWQSICAHTQALVSACAWEAHVGMCVRS